MSKYSENLPPNLKGAIEWMLDDIKPGSVFLDFGCATGYFGKFLKDSKNCKVFGVEISEDAAEAKKVLDGVYTFDLDGEWPKEVYERKYDYAFFGDVLEHLKYPEEALKKTAKLLKPSGQVFVSIPNIAHLSARLELMAGNFEYESTRLMDDTHLKYFTLNSFNTLAHKAGYKLKLVDYSLLDYPKTVIEAWLDKLGLKTAPKFWKLADRIEARAYQYKFVLTPVRAGASANEKAIVKPQKPEQARDAYTDDLKSQVKALRNHAKEQARIIEHLSAKEHELDRIKSNRVYRSAKKIKKIISK